jgi:lipopolysaccharide assembly outer membrane protein LptD (OstA)
VGRPIREGLESGPREYAKLKIYQGYSFGDPFERDESGRGRYFSDVVGELWWNFGPYATARGDVGISPYDGTVKRLNGLVTLRDHRNDSFQVEYRKTKNTVSEVFNLTSNSFQVVSSAGGIETLNLTARVRTIASLYFFGGVSYNLKDSQWTERIYGSEYRAQCWTLGLVVGEKGSSTTSFNASELTFQVYLNLLGLGSVAGRPSPMRF